jgi:hypothetical protein
MKSQSLFGRDIFTQQAIFRMKTKKALIFLSFLWSEVNFKALVPSPEEVNI